MSRRVFRIVQIETLRRVYDIEADDEEGAMAALRHVRPNPIEEECQGARIVRMIERKP